MPHGKGISSEWNVFVLIPSLDTSSTLMNMVRVLRNTGCSKIILPVDAVSLDGHVDCDSLIVNVSSMDSISMIHDRNVYGLFFDAASATNHPLVQEAAKHSVRTYLTINALSRRDLDRLVVQFSPGSLVLVWDGRHSSQDNATVDILSLHQVAKLKRAYDLPLAYLGQFHKVETLLAFVLGAGTVINSLDLRFVGELGRVDTQGLVLMEEFMKQVEEIRADCIADHWPSPSPEEWDIIENGMTSLFAAHFIQKGETLTPKMIEVRAPYQGVGASLLPRLIGCKAKYDIQPGDAITFGLLDLDSLIKS